ncbi:MAG: hypothetical protein WDZ37_03890 [Solirubrobacterales bacterium]
MLVALLARAGIGIDFDGSGWEFLQSVPFMATLVALVVATTVYERPPRRLPTMPMAVVAATLGALELAGSLAAEGYAGTAGLCAGLIAGAVCAVLGFYATRAFIGGASDRLAARGKQRAAGLLDLYGDAAALAVAAVALLVPPIVYLPLAFCVWVLVNDRRRGGKKYQGLRVLR